MKRTLLYTLASFFLLACGEEVQDGRVPIYFWYSQKGPYAQPMVDIIEKFNQSQDSIYVYGIYSGRYDVTSQKLINAVIAENPPELAQISISYAPQFVLNEVLLSLDEFMAADTAFDRDDFFKPMLNMYRFNGKLYALPLNQSTPVLYYNKDLFRKQGLDPNKPPTTWCELHHYALKIAELGQDHTGFNYYLDDWIVESTMLQFGCDLYSPNHRRVTIASEEGVQALTFIRAMVDDGSARVLGDRDGDLSDISGRTGMVIRSSGSLEYLKSHISYDLGVAPLIAGTRRALLAGGGGLFMFELTPPEKRPHAWAFMKYLTNAENNLYYAMRSGYSVTHKSGFSSPTFQQRLQEDPRLLAIYQQFDDMVRPAPLTVHQEIVDILVDAFASVLAANAPVRQTLQTAADKAQPVLDEFWQEYGETEFTVAE